MDERDHRKDFLDITYINDPRCSLGNNHCRCKEGGYAVLREIINDRVARCGLLPTSRLFYASFIRGGKCTFYSFIVSWNLSLDSCVTATVNGLSLSL